MEKDNGQSDAINKGLDLANGSFIGWLNSDDLLLPDAVEKAVTTLMQQDNCVIAYGDAQVINIDGEEISTLSPPPNLSYKQFLNSRVHLVQPGSFYPVNLFRQVGKLDTNLHLAMDRDLWLRLLRYGKGYHRFLVVRKT